MMHPDPADPPVLQMPPAAADGVQQSSAVEHPSTMVTVTCISLEGASVELNFPRHTTLRAMQKPLCSAFGKNWPYSAAAVCVDEEAFSDFEHVPLRAAKDFDKANVGFTRQISDPYGYDQISRKRGIRITLEDECTWEELATRGETDMDLEEWVSSKLRSK